MNYFPVPFLGRLFSMVSTKSSSSSNSPFPCSLIQLVSMYSIIFDLVRSSCVARKSIVLKSLYESLKLICVVVAIHININH